MSIEVMSLAWNLPLENHTLKLVLIALADHCNQDCDCWPSIDYLAAKCDLSRQGVMDQLSSLNELGYIEIEKSSGRVNRYHLNLSHQMKRNQSTALTGGVKTPVNGVDYYQSTRLTGPVNGVDPNRKEPSLEPSIAKLKDFPERLRSGRVMNKWQVWMTQRRAFKKPKDWLVLFNEQVEWLSKFDEPVVFEILSASIRNGWQGLFAPKSIPASAGQQSIIQQDLSKMLDRIERKK